MRVRAYACTRARVLAWKALNSVQGLESQAARECWIGNKKMEWRKNGRGEVRVGWGVCVGGASMDGECRKA